jgi:hypothetical protein
MRLLHCHPDEAARKAPEQEPPHFATVGTRVGHYADRVTVRTTGVRQPGPSAGFKTGDDVAGCPSESHDGERDDALD